MSDKVVNIEEGRAKQGNKKGFEPLPPVKMPSFIPLMETQKVGYASIVEKVKNIQAYQMDFLLKALRELGYDPDDPNYEFSYLAKEGGFSVKPRQKVENVSN